MAIIGSAKLEFSKKRIVMIITAPPSLGKTTLALSARDPLLLDFDEGVARVDAAHRKDTSICKTFDEVREDVKAAKGKYQTIIVDTGGALIDMLKQHIVDHPAEYKGGAKASGGISLQGFGFVKQLFLEFSADLRKNFDVIFIFHENMVRNGEDGVFYDIVCEGSAKSLVYMPADLAAHLFIQNGQRYLGFTPTEQYNAKSAYGIKGLIPVPELHDGDKNDFLTKLFDQVRSNLAKETAELAPQKKQYDEVMARAKELLDEVKDLDGVNDFREAFANMPKPLTSEKEVKAMFKEKTKSLGIVFDRASRQYVYESKAAE